MMRILGQQQLHEELSQDPHARVVLQMGEGGGTACGIPLLCPGSINDQVGLALGTASNLVAHTRGGTPTEAEMQLNKLLADMNAIYAKYAFPACPCMLFHFCIPFSPLCCMCFLASRRSSGLQEVLENTKTDWVGGEWTSKSHPTMAGARAMYFRSDTPGPVLKPAAPQAGPVTIINYMVAPGAAGTGGPGAFCGSCGQRNNGGAFCTGCGVPLAPPAEEPKPGQEPGLAMAYQPAPYAEKPAM